MPRIHQVAALPWRRGETGTEILLVTTRTSRRWVVPKGWTMDGKADHEAAAQEAFEEAGVRGVAEAVPLGNYGYIKMLQSGKPRRLSVRVFSLAVSTVLDDWPERTERERRWVTPHQALQMVGEPDLLPIIADFARIPLATKLPLKPVEGDDMWSFSALLQSMFRWFKV